MPATRPVVLVLDDDRATRELLIEILEEQGYAVESAADSASAERRLQDGGIDLVVLDRVLPDRDGLELCRWVRQREHGARTHLPIVLLTASTGEADEATGLEAGADAYVAKPFGIDDLLAQLQAGLQAGACSAASDEPRPA